LLPIGSGMNLRICAKSDPPHPILPLLGEGVPALNTYSEKLSKSFLSSRRRIEREHSFLLQERDGENPKSSRVANIHPIRDFVFPLYFVESHNGRRPTLIDSPSGVIF
jgi:hypothetical protein